MNSLDTSFELGGSLLDTTTVDTTSHAVTWSFTTSEDPWTAGSKSDVFVVPNLFVEVEEVYKVFWNNIEPFCKAAVDETENEDGETLLDRNMNPFPSQLEFSVGSETSEQALAFYSRYHVEAVKIPDLESATGKQYNLLQDMKTKPVCCSAKKENGRCPPGKRNVPCKPEDIIEEEADYTSLVDALESWKNNLLIKADTEYVTGITPGKLINEAKPLTGLAYTPPAIPEKPEKPRGGFLNFPSEDEINEYEKKLQIYTEAVESTQEANTKLKNSKRYQISGGGNTFSVSITDEIEGKFFVEPHLLFLIWLLTIFNFSYNSRFH